jgi:signal transduction histidine kinase
MALKEIILNSIEASPQHGSIVLELKQDDQWVVFRISDQGDGIKEEHRGKIFGPFFSTKKLSSGLGLSFAKEIIESHNGYVTFETGEGRGTTFQVYLPASG